MKNLMIKLTKQSNAVRSKVLAITLGAVCVLALAIQPIRAQEEIIEELKLFSKAIGAITEGYVEEIKPRQLFYEAVKGMLASLDKYCQFFSKEQNELLQIVIKGEYAGIGATLIEIDRVAAVESIQPGSAAEKAGLQIRDKIMKIDGVSVDAKPVSEVAALLRGKESTEVMLSVWRDAIQKMLDVKIVREKIEIESVRDVRIVGKAIGYMRIAEFSENTVEQADKALRFLHDHGMKALIIDLRGNDGGVMTGALALAEKFLPKGKKLISVKSRIEVQRKEYVSTAAKTESNYKIVILVNQMSASASEIFSAAMQDNGRAKIVGTRTFGKASVQSVVPLDEVTAMKLTTAQYVTPNGHVIDQVGIKPDIEVENGDPSTPNSDHQTLEAIELLREYM